jgi:hypothetical protein
MSGPNQTINLEVSAEFYDRYINKLVMPLGGDSNDAVIRFLLSQVMDAPIEAITWMREKCMYERKRTEGYPPPAGDNVFEAYGESVKKRVLRENEAAINLAGAVRAVL